MSKQISEQIVDSIVNNDKEAFMQQFQAALANKVSDALEAKRVEMASTLIAPIEEDSAAAETAAKAPTLTDKIKSRADKASAVFKRDYAAATSKHGPGRIPGAIVGAIDATANFFGYDPSELPKSTNKPKTAPTVPKPSTPTPIKENLGDLVVSGTKNLPVLYKGGKNLVTTAVKNAPKFTDKAADALLLTKNYLTGKYSVGGRATANKIVGGVLAGTAATGAGIAAYNKSKSSSTQTPPESSTPPASSTPITSSDGKSNVMTIPGFNAPTSLERKAKNSNTGVDNTYSSSVVAKNPMSFKDSFADARKGGAKEFTWNGKKYTTDLATSKPKTSTPTTAPAAVTKQETPAAVTKQETPAAVTKQETDFKSYRPPTKTETPASSKDTIDVYKGNGEYESKPMNDNDRKVTAALDQQDADAAARNASKSDSKQSLLHKFGHWASDTVHTDDELTKPQKKSMDTSAAVDNAITLAKKQKQITT